MDSPSQYVKLTNPNVSFLMSFLGVLKPGDRLFILVLTMQFSVFPTLETGGHFSDICTTHVAYFILHICFPLAEASFENIIC